MALARPFEPDSLLLALALLGECPKIIRERWSQTDYRLQASPKVARPMSASNTDARVEAYKKTR